MKMSENCRVFLIFNASRSASLKSVLVITASSQCSAVRPEILRRLRAQV